jgi:hypothetical protein
MTEMVSPSETPTTLPVKALPSASLVPRLFGNQRLEGTGGQIGARGPGGVRKS